MFILVYESRSNETVFFLVFQPLKRLQIHLVAQRLLHRNQQITDVKYELVRSRLSRQLTYWMLMKKFKSTLWCVLNYILPMWLGGDQRKTKPKHQ